MQKVTKYRVVGALAMIAAATMMAVRDELPGIGVRAMVAAIAFGLGAVALCCVVKASR